MGGLEMGADGILRCRSGADCPNIVTAKKYKAGAEKYKKLFKEAIIHIIAVHDEFNYDITNPLYIDELRKELKILGEEK